MSRIAEQFATTERLLTLPEVAGELHCSVRWLQQHLRKHPGIGRRAGRTRVFTVTNASGYTGVKQHPNGSWRAYIRTKHLGMFSTKEEAVAAYQTAALYEYGEFARRPEHRLNRVRRHNAAQHFVVSEEAAKADLLPGARRVK